jgi:AcrR family transcriptional regulator
MPRRRSLTLRDIATAALAVIERDGLDALSMRSVARELRTGAMSLYRYVDDRRGLEELVAASVLDDVDASPPPRSSWIDQVVILVEAGAEKRKSPSSPGPFSFGRMPA